MRPESRRGRSCGSSINMKLAARAILKIDGLRHDCRANLIALQTTSRSFQLLTTPICRPPWEKCIIHQRYHTKAEGWLSVWFRPQTYIFDIISTLTTWVYQRHQIPGNEYSSMYCGACGSTAHQGALMPFLTDIRKLRRHTQIQAHRKNLVKMGVDFEICPVHSGRQCLV